MQPLRVLLVEDNPADRVLVERATRAAVPRIELDCADRLSHGLERLGTESYDAVLLDLSLPDSDSSTTFPKMQKAAGDIPIVVLTGFDDQDAAARAMSAGAQDFLVKGDALEPILGRSLQYAVARQKAETALRMSEQRFRQLVEYAPDMVFRYRLTPTPGLEYVNTLVLDTLGYSLEELTARISNDFSLIHDDDRTLVYEVLAGQSPSARQELRLITKSNETIWIEVNAVPMQDAKGNLVAIHGIARNVTAQRHAEQELEDTRRQLVESQKMEAVGNLAGGIAHDFNNLLTAMYSFGGFALESLASDHPARPDVEEILRAATRAAKLTEQLLAYSRRRPVSPEVVDVNDALNETSAMLARILGENIDLTTRFSPDLWCTKIDVGAFEQVIVNLAVNARDAMPKGGKLTIETSNAELDAGYVGARGATIPAGSYILIAVSDNGHGMDEETKRHAFEPFFTTKELGRGTGLGLATCFGLVRQAGGYIWVYSEPGRGTTFKIYLPRTQDARSGRTLLPESGTRRGHETILVAEDDAQVRSVTTRALEQMGYRVLSAESGEEALALAARLGEGERIDLLLTDVIMPRMTGKDLADRLLRGRPGMKVVYMSGYTENTIVHHGVLDEGVVLLQKPFAPRAVVSKVRSVLDSEVSDALPPKRRVLVIDDDPLLLAALHRQLSDRYDVFLANGGRAGLSAVLDEDYDAVLCDLVMPDLDGRQVFERVRVERPGMAKKFIFVTGITGELADTLMADIDRPLVEKGAGASAMKEALSRVDAERKDE
jgi:PAS domain S-box-containing protein